MPSDVASIGPATPVRAFAAVALGYWTAPGYRLWAWLLTGGMVIMGCATVGVALRLNIWNRDFFNALEKRDVPAVIDQLSILLFIVVAGAICTGITIYIKRRLQIYWRSWLSTATMGRWLKSGRQYQLGLLAADCDNPDGRIAEDIRISDGVRRRVRPEHPAVRPAAHHLPRRPLDAVRDVACDGVRLRPGDPGLYGLGGRDLRHHRLVGDLLPRPQPHRGRQPSSVARGRFPRRPEPRPRERRGHRANARRGRRAQAHRPRPAQPPQRLA